MAVNQPAIGNDQVENSWKLEITNQINQEEARVNTLADRLRVVETTDAIIDTQALEDAIQDLRDDLNVLEKNPFDVATVLRYTTPNSILRVPDLPTIQYVTRHTNSRPAIPVQTDVTWELQTGGIPLTENADGTINIPTSSRNQPANFIYSGQQIVI